MEITLLGRRGCHLCDDAAADLRRAGLEVKLLDVDVDPELQRLYGLRVPVLLSGGAVVAEGRLSKEQVQSLLDRGRESAQGSV